MYIIFLRRLFLLFRFVPFFFSFLCLPSCAKSSSCCSSSSSSDTPPSSLPVPRPHIVRRRGFVIVTAVFVSLVPLSLSPPVRVPRVRLRPFLPRSPARALPSGRGGRPSRPRWKMTETTKGTDENGRWRVCVCVRARATAIDFPDAVAAVSFRRPPVIIHTARAHSSRTRIRANAVHRK